MKKLILFVLLLSSSQIALSKESVVFSCITKSGKQLLITEDRHYYYYSYGKNGRPEMTFKNAKSNTDPVSFGTAFASFELHNKGVDYSISSPTKLDENGNVPDTELIVSKNDKILAITKCIDVLHSLAD